MHKATIARSLNAMIIRALILLFLSGLLAACGGGGGDSSSTDTGTRLDKALVKVSLPRVKSADGSLRYLTRAGAIPEEVDEIHVKVLSLLGDVVASDQLPSSGGVLTFSVDPLTDYTVVVEAYFTRFPPTEMLYRGTADVDRLVPGESRSVTVLMELLVRTQLIAPVAGLPVGGATAAYRFDMEGLTNTNKRWFVNGIEGGNSVFGTIMDGLYTSPAVLPETPTAMVTIRAEPQYLPRFGKETSLLLVPAGVEPGNPVAVDDLYEILEDTVLMNNVLGNDFDTNGDPLALVTTPVSPPAHGALTLSENGDFEYTPQMDFFGSDSFVYAARDPDNNQSQALVQITVTPVNDPPFAKDDMFSTDSGEVLTGNFLGNNGNGRDFDPDDDVLTVIDINDVGGNKGTMDYHPDGSFMYTPGNLPYSYTDTYLYFIADPDGETDSAYVEIRVNYVEPNLPPVAQDDNDFPSAVVNACLMIDVLANDSDPNNDPLTIISVTNPTAGGSAVVNGSQVEYCAEGALTGSIDTFGYTISDGNGGTDNATVTVYIAPDAVDDSASAEEIDGCIATGNVLYNDYYVGVPGEYSLLVTTGPSAGTFLQNPATNDGAFSYLFNSTTVVAEDSFDYELTHTDSGIAVTATVTIDTSSCNPVIIIN